MVKRGNFFLQLARIDSSNSRHISLCIRIATLTFNWAKLCENSFVGYSDEMHFSISEQNSFH